MPTKNFFKNKSDWARRKHLVLSYYLDPAIRKLQHTSRERRVFILDGFAGRGTYEEGTFGSPIYTGTLAEKHRSGTNPLGLFIHNVEPAPEYFKELESCTANWVERGFVKNHKATFQDSLPTVLRHAQNSPLFTFLDPFKHTQLGFNDLVPLLTRQAKTEICVVFFTRMIQRNLQALRPESRSTEQFRGTLSSTMNVVFGGDDWKQLIKAGTLEYDDILNHFANKIGQYARLGYSGESGYVCWKPIYANKDGHIKYHIVFWTRHLDGVELMNDTFVKEAGDLEEMTKEQIALADRQKNGGQGMFSLFDEPDPRDVEVAEQFNSLIDTFLEIGKENSSKIWSRENLISEAIQRRFAEFNRTKHRQAIQKLADQQMYPKITPIDAKQTKSSKTWVLNEKSLLRFDFDR